MGTSNILTFKLKQHTPFIHFQHVQDDASLRATEIKPLLDKFLIKKNLLSVNGKVKKGKEPYFNDIQNLALQYKLSFECTEKEEYIIASYISKAKLAELNRTRVLHISGAPYFGDAKGLVWRNIVMSIKTLNKKVKDLFSTDVLSEFFLLNNFGNRKSKGFGSFSVQGNENSLASAHSVENLFKENHIAVYKKEIEGPSDFTKIFSDINLSYQGLKSGYNLPGNYEKSDLFKYFSKPGRETGWEKRRIKIGIKNQAVFTEKIFAKKYEPIDFDYKNDKVIYINTWKEVDNPKYRFVRALLGLAETNEYLIDYNGEADRETKYVVEINSVDKSLERMASPLTFKVIGNTVYVLANRLPKKIFDSKFDFTLKIKRKVGEVWKTDRKEVSLISGLAVPSESDFDIVKFLDEYIVIKGYKKL